MTTKDTDSMATVQIKPDYAASEVYSTASEAPPLGLFSFNQQAYKRQSNSVKIAKITAFTIIASSFILGAFILASSYLEAKASCDQVQALDSVLEKELMLETLQQVNKELPRAEALLGKENSDESELQNLDSDTTVKKVELKKQQSAKEDDTNDDNSYSDVEEVEDKYPGKVPLELDLSDLAAALLQNNKKSRMNCVVERKHAEEIVDSPSKTVSLPFGVNLTTDPKKARITGERISIYCEGGNENKEQQEGARDSMRNNNNHEEDDDNEDDAEPLRPMFIPYQRIPIPFGQIPERFPLTHMPQRMMPPMMGAPQQHMQHMQQPFIRQMPPPFQQLPMRPPMPPQVMQAPEPESHSQNMLEMQQPQTVRIHVQQIPIREIHVADDVPVQIPSQHQQPKVQIVSLPLSLALQRAGITAEDLRNIQRMAEDRFIDEIKRLGGEESDELSEINNNSNSDEGDDNSSDTQMSDEQHEQRQQQQQERQQQPQPQPLPQQQQLPELPRPQQPAINPEEVASRNAEQVPVQRLILQPLPEQPRDTMTPPMPDQPQMMQYGRAAFGRSLAQPVRIPVPMMHAREESESAVMGESERPHFVQPRSV